MDFLARLPPVERAGLLALAEPKDFGRSEPIFRAGDLDNYVYVLERGRAKIYHLTSTGKEILLWFCVSGEIFGLAEICHTNWRRVYAGTCEPSRVLAVARDHFSSFLQKYPTAAILVNEVLAYRLRILGHIIESLVASDVNERVAQLLIRLAASHGRKGPNGDICLTIRITHQEMANMIGTTRQSVTTALNALRRRGVLSLENGHMRIARHHFCANGSTTGRREPKHIARPIIKEL